MVATVTGYNASPPSDDGSETDANKVKWSTIKTKLTDPLKDALDAFITDANNYDTSFPAGTAMLFYNNAAPTGWTVVTGKTASNHYAIRVLNTATAGSGGATTAAQGHSPILNDKVPSHTHGVGSFATASDGSHTHTGTATSSGSGHTHTVDMVTGTSGALSGPALGTSANDGGDATTNEGTSAHTHSLSINSGGSHTHTLSGTSAANGSADDWEPSYHDVILCDKD